MAKRLNWHKKRLLVLILVLLTEIVVLAWQSFSGFPVVGRPERVFVGGEGDFLFQTFKGPTFKGYFGDRADPGRHRLRLERAGAALELALTTPAQDPVLAKGRPGQDRVLEATPSARLLRLQAEAEARLSQERQQISSEAGQLLGQIEAQVADITQDIGSISAGLESIQTQSAQIEAAVERLVGQTFIAIEDNQESVKTGEILPGVDISQQVIKEGVRQKIIFKTPSQDKSLNFSLDLEGLIPTKDEKGNWRFLNQSGRPFFSLSQLVLEDAAGKQGAVTLEVSPPPSSPQPNSQPTTHYSLLINIDPSWLSSPDRLYPVTLKQDILAILLGLTAAKETFTALEELVFDFEYWPEDGPVAQESIKPTLLTTNGQTIPVGAQIEKLAEGKYRLRFPPPRTLRAGRHTLKLEYEQAGSLKTAEQDFSWGVLAINVDKSIYLSSEALAKEDLPPEQAYLQMAVLDEGGKTVCDAALTLQILNPKFQILNLSTEDGTIKKSPECGPNTVTYTPDYFAYYQVGEPGVYQLQLTAETANGTHTITDSFEIRDSVPFDILRYGPTRIYPPEPYQMRLTIKANQDFAGEIKELVPASFSITGQEGMAQSSEGSTQVLTWQVNLSSGQTKEFTYEFDAPNESPQFYLLGPLELATVHRSPTTIFTETRRWQIAVDQAANVYTAESLTTSSTTSTTLQNKVTLNFTPGATAEHWVVVATGEVRRTDAVADVNGDGVILGRYALSLDGTVIPVTPFAGYAGSGAGVTGGNHTAWKTFQVFRKITGFNTQRTAIIQWRSESGGPTEIRNARILAFRIPNEASANIQYVEALSVVNDTVNPTSALTLTFTPSSQGDYVLMAQGFHHEGPGGASTGGLFWVDEGTEATNTSDSYIGQNEPGVPFFHIQRKNLTAASHTFILRHKPDITTGSERFGLAILAFRADVFDNTETSEALTTTTTTSTTYQNKINFTIATAASARDHVFLGGHTPDHATSDTNDGRYGRWLLNSVEITEEAPAQLRGGYLKSQGLAWTLNTVGGIAVQAQFRSPDGVITASDAQARLVVLRYPAAGTANATQIHYRWRNDDGDEVDTGDGADGLLAPTGAFNLNTDESGGRTYPDGIAYRVVAPADAASSVSQYSASDDFQGIAAGDEVLLINMQGTSTDNADVGNYEFMEVQSVTSTTLTFTASISKSYDGTTASNQKVVVQRVPNYTSVTLDSTDSLTASAWDGLSACSGGAGASCRLTGMVAFRATATVSVGTGTSITVAGRGYRLGSGVASGNNIRGSQGESYTGPGASATSTANGGGGGGGELTNVGGDACGGGGAGGGYGASGSSGGYGSSCGGTLPANGPGATYGSADLSRIFLGSGGGGGGKDEHSDANCPGNPASGDGANGGGIVIAFANTISVSGSVSANGNNGSTAPCLGDNGNGGGGTGGSVYLAAVNATLGTNLVTATAGSGAASGGVWNGAGGNGGTGRIRVETGSVTSVTTNPSASLSANAPAGATFAAAQDTLLSGLAKSTTKRLRIEISNEGGASTGALTYRLEASGPNPAACSSAVYTRVDTDTHWDVVASTYITDGDPTANIHVAGTQALTDENTTFVAGRLEESADQLVSTIDLATTGFTEIEYSVQATTSATDGATYCFRLTNAGSTTNFTYTQYAQVTLAGAAGPTTDQLLRHGDWFSSGVEQPYTF